MSVSELAAKSLTIRSAQGDYDVVTCETLEKAAALTATPETLVAIDRRVYELYPDLAKLYDPQRTYTLPATEDEKTLQGVERLCRFLQEKGASKKSRLLVIGGGIAQDIGTFAAHVYYRGIPYTFMPTTLLSMADSCIGAKCAVNLGEFKNQLGFFQSPERVVVWPGFLETLAADDIRSGFGEIIKLAITSGPEDYDWLEKRLDEQGFSVRNVQPAILRSLETKRRVIEQDEYEKNLRKTLNYGHTFGHALESLTHHEVPHGLAVAWGVDLANFAAMRYGLLSASTFERIHAVLARHFAFEVHGSYSAESLIAAMRRDKKAAGTSVTLILPAHIGDLQLVPRELDGELEALVQAYLDEYDIFG